MYRAHDSQALSASSPGDPNRAGSTGMGGTSVRNPLAVHQRQRLQLYGQGGSAAAAVGRADRTPATLSQNGSSPQRMSELSQMKLKEGLRDLCQQYAIPHTGRKSEVISRILKHEGLMD